MKNISVLQMCLGYLAALCLPFWSNRISYEQLYLSNVDFERNRVAELIEVDECLI